MKDDISTKNKNEKQGGKGKIKVGKNGPYIVSGEIPLAEHKMDTPLPVLVLILEKL